MCIHHNTLFPVLVGEPEPQLKHPEMEEEARDWLKDEECDEV